MSRITDKGQATSFASVTPHDTNNLDGHPVGLYIGTAGNLAVIASDDDTNTAITFTNVAVGFFPVQVKRVLATGTTASGIIALY